MPREPIPCENGCGRTFRPYAKRKTRMCKICCAIATGRSAAKIEKTRAAMMRHHADPAYQAMHSRRVAQGIRDLIARNPAELERRRAAGVAVAQTGLGHACQPKGSEPRMRAARATSDRRLSWCPKHLRAEYRRLVRSGRKAVEARAIIEKRMAQERAARGQRVSFEEQLRMLQSGQATLSRKFTPSSDTGPFTLGGVGSGML